MMNKFNDFSALNALKKEMVENESSVKNVAPQPQKRNRTVVHKPKDLLEGRGWKKNAAYVPAVRLH